MATRFFGDDDTGAAPPPAPTSPRVALVVGNGSYRTSRLENPPRDARLIGRVLEELGFDIELVIDGGKAVLETAIVRLGERLEKAGPEAVGFFYFAGHGIQHLGANYLVPVDAQIPDTRYLKSGAVTVDYLVEELARAPSRANVIVLDACRDSAVRDTGGGLTQGLASIQRLPDGTLVVFSTAAGQVAEDGSGENSPYARALARHMLEPNRRLEEIFFAVSREVAQATTNAQRPALFVQGAIAPIILNERAEAAPVAEPPAVPVAPAPAAVPASEPAAETRRLPAGEAALADLALAAAEIGPETAAAPAAPAAQGLAAPMRAPAVPPRPALGRPALAALALAAVAAGLAGAGLLLWPKPRPAETPVAGETSTLSSAGTLTTADGAAGRTAQAAAVDLTDPGAWPVAADGALVWRAESRLNCLPGWTRVLDGLYCLRSERPLGALWETGAMVAPQASAITLAVADKREGRCPPTALFEAETACLTPATPSWLPADPPARADAAVDLVGEAAGTARLEPRASPACTTTSQLPFAAYCLASELPLGLVTPTTRGHERLGAGPAGAPVTLTVYRRLTRCPPLSTVLENERYCLAMAMW